MLTIHMTLAAGTRPLVDLEAGDVRRWDNIESMGLARGRSHRSNGLPAARGQKTDGRITIKAPAKRSLSVVGRVVEEGISALFRGQLDSTLSIEAPSVTMCPGAGENFGHQSKYHTCTCWERRSEEPHHKEKSAVLVYNSVQIV